MDTTLWLMGAVGAVLGFFAGRTWAEFRRARVDMRGIWNGRRRYRGR